MLQGAQDLLQEKLAAIHARRSALLVSLRAQIPIVEETREHTEPEPASEVVVQKGVELGGRVYLDEDIYDGAHVLPRLYVFEAYDSEAPAESNCTLVDAVNGDWTVRGIGELVPVDDMDEKEARA